MVRWFVETGELRLKIRDIARNPVFHLFLVRSSWLRSTRNHYVSALIQDILKTKLDWDHPSEEGFLVSWRSWVNQLPSLAQLAYHVATSYAKWVASSVNCNCIFPLIHVGYSASAYLRVDPLFVRRWKGKKCSS